MYLLSLDPSINHLGWAIFEFESPPTELSYWTLKWCGTLHTEKYKKHPTYQRILFVIQDLKAALAGVISMPCTFEYITIEEPQLWGAYKSMASQHSTSLLVLHLLTGALIWWGWDCCTKVRSITVSKWKGQLSKHITKQRMEQQWHRKFKTSDEADAVGLGTYFIEKELKYGTAEGS